MNPLYDNNNVFAQILRGEAPCFKVYEDEMTLAFMDIMPQLEGHTLVIPKEPAITIYDLSDEAALALIRTVRLVGPAVEKAMGVGGSTLFQLNGVEAGQTVPHIHFHILPGSVFQARGLKGHASEMADPADLQRIAARIIECLGSSHAD